MISDDQCETLLRPDRTRTLGYVNTGPAPLAASGHLQYTAFDGTDHLNRYVFKIFGFISVYIYTMFSVKFSLY